MNKCSTCFDCWGCVLGAKLRAKFGPGTDHKRFLLVCFSYVVVMPNKRQALVEYEDMNGSSTAVTYAADNQVYIAGHPAFINYSTSKKISRPGDSDDSRSVNNVLLFTIMNPIYPITTVNTQICAPHNPTCKVLFELLDMSQFCSS